MKKTIRHIEFHDVTPIGGCQPSELVFLLLCGCEGKTLVAYSFGRLVNDWLKDVHPKCLERLAQAGQCRWRGTCGNWSIRYIPNRLFDVGLIEPAEGYSKRRAVVYDISSWFGDKTLEEACATSGAAGRSVVSLASFLCGRLDGLDLRPSSGWYGPGASASMLMRRHKVAEHNQTPSDNAEGFDNLFRRAYFGGRIQALRVGACGPSLRYDLRSAYASAMVGLPSLKGRWVPLTERGWLTSGCLPDDLVMVEWDTPEGCSLTPFPWRGSDGHISYPRKGRGWYWGSLVRAALRGPWTVLPRDGWRRHPEDENARPFAYLRELHAERRAFAGQPEADLLKSIMVASYGKLAQQGGYPSRHRSLAWAGMVTAQVQAWLLEAALKAPGRVASFLTDALCVAGEEPLDLPLGDGLGQWSESAYNGLWTFQPAFYVTAEYADGTKNKEARFDLHAAGAVDDQMIARRAVGQWMARGLHGKVLFTDEVWCGVAMAQQRGWSAWRKPITLERELRLHPAQGFPGEGYKLDEASSAYRWNTWTPGEDYSVLSHPYEPRGGGLLDGRWEEVEAIRASEECR